MGRVTGETDLGRLLAGLDPELHDGVYVFATLRDDVPGLDPIMVFAESEGRTVIARAEEAHRAGLGGVFPSAWITLRVHSSLEAVGLMAAVSTALAEAGISCNAVSAYHHDHLFVPYARAQDALDVLHRLRSPRPRRG
ncbi:MAG TPA: ACT domain-containing protein [Actinoallomurus sp.]